MFYSRWLDRNLAAAWIPGAMPSKHRLGRTLEPDFLPVLGKRKKKKKSLELHLFNELSCCLCCGDGSRLFSVCVPLCQEDSGTLLACFMSDEDRCCFACLS